MVTVVPSFIVVIISEYIHNIKSLCCTQKIIYVNYTSIKIVEK